MQRYTPGQMPQGSFERVREHENSVTPVSAICGVCEFVKLEHGNAGVRRCLGVLQPFLTPELIQGAAKRLGVEPPPPPTATQTQTQQPPPPPPPRKEIPMDQLMKLLSSNGGQKGIDPAMLLQMLGKN